MFFEFSTRSIASTHPTMPFLQASRLLAVFFLLFSLPAFPANSTVGCEL